MPPAIAAKPIKPRITQRIIFFTFSRRRSPGSRLNNVSMGETSWLDSISRDGFGQFNIQFRAGLKRLKNGA